MIEKYARSAELPKSYTLFRELLWKAVDEKDFSVSIVQLDKTLDPYGRRENGNHADSGRD